MAIPCFGEKEVVIEIAVPVRGQGLHEITGKVVWCAQKETHVDIGIEFQTRTEAYLAKTIEELCYIRKFEKNHPPRNG